MAKKQREICPELQIPVMFEVSENGCKCLELERNDECPFHDEETENTCELYTKHGA